MSKNNIDLRRKKYFKLSSQIAQFDNTQLCSLFDNSESNESSAGWGMNNTIVLGQSKVFIKRVPMTDTEYSNMFSTKNLYELPTYCSYGLGSTGFGDFRELVTYIKTTNWVLEGSIATFPLLYHYRIIPFFGQRVDVDRNRQLRSILLDNIEQIQSDGLMKLNDFYVVSIVKYRSIIALMQNFFFGHC